MRTQSFTQISILFYQQIVGTPGYPAKPSEPHNRVSFKVGTPNCPQQEPAQGLGTVPFWSQSSCATLTI